MNIQQFIPYGPITNSTLYALRNLSSVASLFFFIVLLILLNCPLSAERKYFCIFADDKDFLEKARFWNKNPLSPPSQQIYPPFLWRNLRDFRVLRGEKKLRNKHYAIQDKLCKTKPIYRIQK